MPTPIRARQSWPADLGGGNTSQYWIEDDGKHAMIDRTAKPPYRVPSMAEIAAIPWNGLTVASTFSGAGGSCTGYRMAGYRVVWANEFVPIAQQSYKANAAPDCYLDPRDVRTVQVSDILAQTGMAVGELDLFDGSPPCQAFSTAGKRAKGWGQERHYEHGASQKNEELFFEYIRLLDGLKPRVFVAENVSGLVKGVAKGFFLEILAGLKACGYNVTAKVLDAQWLGVPQTRQRVIFVGVREDIGKAPAFPTPLPYRYSVRDALPELTGGVIHDTAGQWARDDDVTDRPCPAITNGVNALNSHHFKVTHDERGHHGKTGDITGAPAPALLAGTVGNLWIEHDESGQWSAGDVTDQPAPTVRSGRAGTMMITGRTGSRFKRVESEIDQPMNAIQCSDPEQTRYEVGTQRRKFTIAEVKRICAFPDDFILCGSYAQQWSCLGNSVPPVMMYHIAAAIRDRVLLDA